MKPLATLLALALPALATAQEKITYDDHVRTIFEDKCFSCHNPDKAKGGLDLTSYGNTIAGGSSGQIALAGDPGNSKLYNVLTHAEEPVMPPKGDKLGDDKLDIVGKWLTGGLLETSSSTAKKAQKPAFAMTLDAPAGKPDGPPPMPGQLALEPEVVTARATVVADIATSPWAPVIAVTGQKQVLLHHSDSLELLGVLPYPEGFPMTLTFSRSGKLVVAGGGRHGKS
ncbi:MAG: hypothetical protein P8J87_00320, partial [Verrucomicrobiales bacterium]|nr:hypothetical protein [Verrucomicrobiales bacterium]